MDQREREYRKAIGRGEDVEFIDPATAEKYPKLAALMVPRLSSQGFRLDPVSFTVRVGLHCCVVTARDPNWATTLTATCEALDDCWAALEALLDLANPPWISTGKDPKLRKPKIPQ